MTGFSNSSNSPSSLIIPGQGYVPSSYGPATANTRRAVLAMGGDGDAGAVTPANGDVCQRYGFTVPSTGGAAVSRFRFRIRNSNVKSNTTTNGTVNLGALAIGVPNVAAETVWAGDFTAVPTPVIPAPGLTELGTSEYVSAWVAPSTFALTPGKFLGLTMAFTLTGTAGSVGSSPTPGWSWAGTGSAAANLLAAVPGTTPQPYLQYLDVRMEYEFAGTNEVGFFVGDSLTDGFLQTQTAASALGHMGPDNCWPQQAALRLGHHALNGGVGGIGTGGWIAATPSTNLAWSRFLAPESGGTSFASTPDYAVIVLNVNDNSALSLATFQSNYQTIIARLQALGITRIYAGTEGPGYNGLGWEAGQLGVALTGAFTGLTVVTKGRQGGVAVAQMMESGPGYQGGQPGVVNAFTWGTGAGAVVYVGIPEAPVTGGGPLTTTAAATGGAGAPVVLTVAGTATAPIGTPVCTLAEYQRRAFNYWIRSVPPGVQSVIDFDADTTSQFYYPSATGRPEYFGNLGDVHPLGGGMYSMWASRFVNGILGN